jgi:hypothetical protein
MLLYGRQELVGKEPAVDVAELIHVPREHHGNARLVRTVDEGTAAGNSRPQRRHVEPEADEGPVLVAEAVLHVDDDQRRAVKGDHSLFP